MKEFNVEEVRDFINRQSPETKIYIGCDSYRYKKEGVWYARYTTVCVVHIDGKRGCSVWGLIDSERDYDAKKNRPINRMMNEVYRAARMFLDLAPAIGDRAIELHVDINVNPKFGSNVAHAQAQGYIKGTCNIEPKFKPNALIASFAADHFRTFEGKASKAEKREDRKEAKTSKKKKKERA